MKKLLLSAIALLSICSISFGQLALQDTSGATLKNGDTVTVTGLVGTQLADRFFIYDSAFALSVKVLCIPTPDSTAGNSFSICVGTACYIAYPLGGYTFLSPKFTVPAGKKDTNALFTDYNAKTAGTSIIMYSVRNTALTDSTWIYVKFMASPTGIPTIAANNLHVSALYPNPANSQVSLNYHSDYEAQLSVYNSLGQMVKTSTMAASKGNMSINTSDMPSGIYICKVQAAGAEPAFRKLIVSH